MSMNLAFLTQSGHYVDFPFQTPTDLSYAVINLKTRKAQLELIEKTIRGWEWDDEQVEYTMSEVESLLQDPALTLTVV